MSTQKTQIEITANDKTARAFNSVTGRLNKIAGAVGATTAAIGTLGGVGVAYIVNAARETSQLADEMTKAAQRIGTTTERLSELKYAADLNDVSFEQLQTGLSKIAKTAEDFRNNSKTAVDAFAKLEIDPTTFKDTSDLLGAVGDKLSQMEDGARKTAIAQELLGRSGAQLIPLLNSGAEGLAAMAAEARELGVVIDQETADAAVQFNDNMTRLNASAKALSLELGVRLVPGLADITDEVVRMTKQYGLLAGAIGLVGKSVDVVLNGDTQDRIAEQITKVQSQIYQKNREFQKATKAGNTALAADIQSTIKGLALQLNVIKSAQDGVKDAAKKTEQLEVKDPLSTVKKSLNDDTARKYAAEMAKLVTEFERAVAPTQTLSEKLQAQLDTYSDLDPALEKYLQGIVSTVEAQERAAETAERFAEHVKTTNELMANTQAYDDNAQRIYDANAETFNQIVRETQDLNITLIADDRERAKAQIEIEHERRLARIALLEGEAEQVEAIREAENARFEKELEKLEKTTKKANGVGKDLGLTFKSAFEDAIVEGKKFSEVLKGIEQDITRMLTRKLVTEPLNNAIDGLLGSVDLGGIFKDILPFAHGGVPGGAGISDYRNQVVDQPTFFAFAKGAGLMGEAGAEAIMPLTRTNSGDLGVRVEGAGGATVVNVHNHGRDNAEVNERFEDGVNIIDVVIGKAKQAIAQDIHTGKGAVPAALGKTYQLQRQGY